ncbi:MAG: hypothetical protein IKJ35_02365 [Clostridia bacterium]|nr:hypothetical protein [Clostridia bacterium]
MKKEVTAETKRVLIFLLINSVIMIFLYFWLPTQWHFEYLPAIYLVVGVIFALYYVIYNRGFVFKNATPEMPPSHLSMIEKQRLIEDAKLREKKSRWTLTLVVPILLTFLADMVYLFIFPYFERMFA